MIRLIFLFLFITITICSNAQTGGELLQVIRRWPNKVDINVSDGMIHKRLISDESDTAFYFHAQGKKFIATTTFKEVGGVVVPPADDTTRIDGAKATFSTGQWATGSVPGWYKGTIAYSNTPNATATFSFTGTKVELWAEKLPTHGAGVITITRGTTVVSTANISFVGPKALPTLIYSSSDLQALPYTITLKVTSGYCLLDFFVVKNYVPSSGSVPPPTGDIIDVLPGENLKNKIESASSGTTVRIANAVFNSPSINVPVGVNVECGPSTVLTCSSTGESSLFNFKSSSTVSTKQTISNCTLEGNNATYSMITVENRNVDLTNVKIKNTNFTGAWIKNSIGTISGCDFYNAGWSGASYLSGALNIFNSPLVIQNNTFRSDKNSKGTGIEALWPENNTLTNLKILNNTFKLSHHNPWNGGTSKNFAIEFVGVTYRGIEIAGNNFGNEVSLASHKPGNGTKTIVRDNIGDLGGDDFFLEVICSDIEVYNNNITGARMFSANMQPNSRWVNHTYRNNTFISSGPVGWGAIFLFGPTGVSNVLIENNNIKLNGNVLTKWMGTDKTGVTVGANTIQ